MSSAAYDIVTVGGGLGGAALAKVMAKAGARVLVIEREPAFRDRVRGEFLAPWGVAEGQQLAIADLLRACGCDVPLIETGLGLRDLRTTTPQRVGAIGFSHPDMQERLLQAAEGCGAHVRRGAVVTAVDPGQPPRVEIRGRDGDQEMLFLRRRKTG